MLNKLKDILNAKVPVYVVLLIIFIFHISNDYYNKQIIDKNTQENRMIKKYYWPNGKIREKHYYNGRNELKKCYYYTQNGYLSFIDDLDQRGKKYIAWIRKGNSDFPNAISYILDHTEEGITAIETYNIPMRQLDSLCIDIPFKEVPSKKIHISIAYDENRYISSVIYDIPKPDDSSLSPNEAKTNLKHYLKH